MTQLILNTHQYFYYIAYITFKFVLFFYFFTRWLTGILNKNIPSVWNKIAYYCPELIKDQM